MPQICKTAGWGGAKIPVLSLREIPEVRSCLNAYSALIDLTRVMPAPASIRAGELCRPSCLTGAATLSSRSRRSKSMPLSSGILTSVMMQPAWTVGATLRNPAADSYVRTSIPADPSWNASTSRTAWSSSMTWTMDFSAGIAGFLLRRSLHGKAKDRSTGGIRLHRDPSTVGLDNGATDGQADTHAMRLAGNERLEEL